MKLLMVGITMFAASAAILIYLLAIAPGESSNRSALAIVPIQDVMTQIRANDPQSLQESPAGTSQSQNASQEPNAPAEDPTNAVRAFEAAQNARDIDAALAVFAADAIVQTPQGTFVGTDQIRSWLGQLAKANFVVEPGRRETTGAKVAWPVQISLDDVQRQDIALMRGSAEAVVEGGKIQSFTLNVAQEPLVKLLTASASAPDLPKLLPRSGQPIAPLPIAFVGGALLLMLGAAIRTPMARAW